MGCLVGGCLKGPVSRDKPNNKPSGSEDLASLPPTLNVLLLDSSIALFNSLLMTVHVGAHTRYP